MPCGCTICAVAGALRSNEAVTLLAAHPTGAADGESRARDNYVACPSRSAMAPPLPKRGWEARVGEDCAERPHHVRGASCECGVDTLRTALSVPSLRLSVRWCPLWVWARLCGMCMLRWTWLSSPGSGAGSSARTSRTVLQECRPRGQADRPIGWMRAAAHVFQETMSIAANSALAPDTVTLSMVARCRGGFRDEALRSVVGAAAMKSCLLPDPEPAVITGFEDVVAPEDVAHNASLSADEPWMYNRSPSSRPFSSRRPASPGKLEVTCARCSSCASRSGRRAVVQRRR